MHGTAQFVFVCGYCAVCRTRDDNTSEVTAATRVGYKSVRARVGQSSWLGEIRSQLVGKFIRWPTRERALNFAAATVPLTSSGYALYAGETTAAL